jgi:hypothetical protein
LTNQLKIKYKKILFPQSGNKKRGQKKTDPAKRGGKNKKHIKNAKKPNGNKP